MRKSRIEKAEDAASRAVIAADELTASTSEGYVDDIALRLLVKSIPILGPVLDTVISEPGMRARAARITNFLTDLKDDVARLSEEKVDNEFLKTPEFEGVIERTLRAASLTSREGKLALLRKALVGAMSPLYSRNACLDSFMQAVEVLTPEHVRLLDGAHVATFSKRANMRTKTPKSDTTIDDPPQVAADGLMLAGAPLASTLSGPPLTSALSGPPLTSALSGPEEEDDFFERPTLSKNEFYEGYYGWNRPLVDDLIARGFMERLVIEGNALRSRPTTQLRVTALGEQFLWFLRAGAV